MKKLIKSLFKTAVVSTAGAIIALILPLLILNNYIAFEMSNEELSLFYHYVLLAHCAALWLVTTIVSLASHAIKNENMRIPLFWSCAYLPITYGLIRVVIELA